MTKGLGLRLRAMALAVSVALAVGLAACGDSDETGRASDGAADASSGAGDGSGGAGEGAGGGEAAESAGEGAGGTEEEQLRDVIAKFQQAMKDADGEDACGLMVGSAQRLFASYGQKSSGNCPAGFRNLMKENITEDPTPEITDVRIDGEKAVVTAEPAKDKMPPEPPVARFAKQGGEWKVKEWFTTRGGG